MANLFNSPFNPSSLSQDQQELLMAALTSNRSADNNQAHPPSREVFDFASGSLENAMFSTDQIPNFDATDLNSFTDQQFMDYLGRGNSLDLDAVAPEDLLDDDDDSPFANETGDHDLHDKRKSPEDDVKDGNENGAKRREGEEKVAKKPGRKPLTSEPTSKRKAQNRAAQRAFRERKEKHVKDLESKVAELERSSETVNHENGLLRAQVEKLTNELKESRKKLSLQTSRGSPQSLNIQSIPPTSLPGLANNFNFDFPQFGSPASYAPLFNNRISQSSISPSEGASFNMSGANSLLGRKESTDKSPGSNTTPSMSDFIKTPLSSIGADSPQPNSVNGLTSSNVFKKPRDSTFGQVRPESTSSYNIFTSPQTTYDNASNGKGTRSDSIASNSRLFQFNSTTSGSSSNSPSSHYNGTNSSCGTSPEPSGQVATTGKDGSLEPITEKDVMKTTDTDNSIAMDTAMPTAQPIDDNFNFFDLPQAKDPFAPMSWIDYPESSTAMLGDGSFTGGFFNDIAPSFDIPMSWNDLTGSQRTGLTPAAQKSNPLESPDVTMETVKEEVVPGEDPNNLIACHKIWDKIYERQDFKDGNLDIDGLCNELRMKAKCSESGVVIDKKDVDAALARRTSGLSPHVAS